MSKSYYWRQIFLAKVTRIVCSRSRVGFELFLPEAGCKCLGPQTLLKRQTASPGMFTTPRECGLLESHWARRGYLKAQKSWLALRLKAKPFFSAQFSGHPNQNRQKISKIQRALADAFNQLVWTKARHAASHCTWFAWARCWCWLRW